jgi:hypothetical protein
MKVTVETEDQRRVLDGTKGIVVVNHRGQSQIMLIGGPNGSTAANMLITIHKMIADTYGRLVYDEIAEAVRESMNVAPELAH